jgi:hypothetical protein
MSGIVGVGDLDAERQHHLDLYRLTTNAML